MEIGGLQKFSLLDYPGHLAAVVFTQGCDFRCQFCYNPMLVRPVRPGELKDTASSAQDEEQKDRPKPMAEDDFFVFLITRQNKLEGVVISGGEPSNQPDLPEFIGKIKALGYLVKLDTNGTRPAMLKKLLKRKLLDYIAMDVKAPAKRYAVVTGARPKAGRIEESIAVIKGSGLPYEFRTTLIPGLVGPDDISGIGQLIRGAARWYLQSFKSDVKLINSGLEGRAAYRETEMEAMRRAGEKYAKKCEWR